LFLNLEELKAFKKFNKLYLQELSEHQIVDYINKSISEENRMNPDVAILNIIENEIIKQIAKRPLFLNLLVDNVRLDAKITIRNSSELYQIVTDDWLSTESLKASTVIDFDTKKNIIKCLAYELFLTKEYKIEYSRLKIVLEKILLERVYVSKELYGKVLDEIVNFGFFDRTNSGELGFSHRSFAEYFVARKYFDDLVNEKVTDSWAKVMYEEIFIFVKEIMENENQFEKLYLTLVNPQISPIFRINTIPPIRNKLEEISIKYLLEVLISDDIPAIKYICGYTLGELTQQYPNAKILKEKYKELKIHYLREKNSLVRLHIALLLNDGKYTSSDIYPELGLDYQFEERDTKEITEVDGTVGAYEIIIQSRKESDFVVEESLRILSLHSKYSKFELEPFFYRTLFDISSNSNSFRLWRCSFQVFDRLEMYKKSNSFSQKVSSISKDAIESDIKNISNVALFFFKKWTK